jgi:hypothetical protein
MKLDTLLGKAEHAGAFRLPPKRLEEIAEAGGRAGLRVFRASLADAKRVPELLDTLASALGFPEWFGENLDALMDCLTDMSWNGGQEAPGYLLLLTGLGTLHRANPVGLRAVIEVMSVASEVWRADGLPFWVLADLPDLPDLPEKQ